ncbi:MAG: EthD family reductase [Acetobacteraceae bacterium]
MIVVSVMYPPSARFDLDYYMKSHIPLVQARCAGRGLAGAQVLKGAAGGDGGAPAQQVIALLSFASLPEFQTAMQEHGAEIMGDVANFTDAQPVIQINTPLD